jgi:hypothetical protein
MKNPRRTESERRRRNRTQKNQIPKDGWADYQGEVSRYEDRYPEEKIYLKKGVVPPTESEPVTMENKEEKIVQPTHSSKSTSPTKQVWKVKVNSKSDSAQLEASLDPLRCPRMTRANKRFCLENPNHRTSRQEVTW